MRVKFEIDIAAVTYLSHVFDEFSSRFSMKEYIPAVYWVINSGVKNEQGQFVVSGGPGYHVVLVAISEAERDLKLAVTSEKIFALRLDPKLIGKTHLSVSFGDGKLEIA